MDFQENKASDPEGSATRIAQVALQAWGALNEAVDFNSKLPEAEIVKRTGTLNQKFIKAAENLQSILESISKTCAAQRNKEATEIALVGSDEERLVNCVCDILGISFDLVTSSRQIFNAWKDELSRCQRNANVSAGFAAAGVFASGVALYSGAAFKSVSVLGPLGIAVVAICIHIAQRISLNTADKEKRKSEEFTRQVGALRTAVQEFGLWLRHVCYGSGLDGIEEREHGQEYLELKELCDKTGLSGSVLTDIRQFQASIDSTRKVIEGHLQTMQQGCNTQGVLQV
ncbi:hypothetical protein ABW21_db0202694 [Orbilia brochopaga]|nr:hypothetical protein ABW21_db0202694 [Drechslerella brochopaga]